LFGACLGHGPPDNSGHKRRLTDTSVLPFTWGNAECQPLPIHWFFPDTEAVMELRLVVTVETTEVLKVRVKLCKPRWRSVRTGSVPQRFCTGTGGHQRSPAVQRNRRSSALQLTQLG
jgi:hypothetical protein